MYLTPSVDFRHALPISVLQFFTMLNSFWTLDFQVFFFTALSKPNKTIFTLMRVFCIFNEKRIN